MSYYKTYTSSKFKFKSEIKLTPYADYLQSSQSSQSSQPEDPMFMRKSTYGSSWSNLKYKPADEFISFRMQVFGEKTEGGLLVSVSEELKVVNVYFVDRERNEEREGKFNHQMRGSKNLLNTLLEPFFGTEYTFQVDMYWPKQKIHSPFHVQALKAEFDTLDDTVCSPIVNLTFGYWPRLTRRLASLVIQKWFKGWSARKAYRYNPYTTLGRHLLLNEMAEFNIGPLHASALH